MTSHTKAFLCLVPVRHHRDPQFRHIGDVLTASVPSAIPDALETMLRVATWSQGLAVRLSAGAS